MVIAALQFQGLVISIDVLPQGFAPTEIHGGSCYVTQLTGGDTCFVAWKEKLSRHHKLLCHGFFRMVMPRQIEITVIGKIKDRIHITDGVKGYSQPGGGF